MPDRSALPPDERRQELRRVLDATVGLSSWQPDEKEELVSRILAALRPAPEPREDQLAIARMERDWLLSAWAAACGVPEDQARADMLKWTSKWRALAVEAGPGASPQAAPPTGDVDVTGFSDWLEPWCSGFIAARDRPGLHEDGQAFLGAAMDAWQDFGGRRATGDALRAERDRAWDALKAIRGPEDLGPWAEAYRAAGGGYEGLQAIADAALTGPWSNE